MKASPVVLTAAVLVVVSVAMSVAVYDRLPNPVPTHFDASGRPNGFTPKPFGAFIGPALIAFLGILFEVLPKISPHGYRMERFERTYQILCCTILGVIFVLATVALFEARGVKIRVDRVVLISIAVLLLIIGNFMGKLTRNFFVGIRTPWTLASDEVWFRTHRFGGWLTVIAALILFAGAFLGGGPSLILVVMIALAVVLTVYSYVIYRRIEGP